MDLTKLTGLQRKALSDMSHLLPVEMLSDGDVLVLDTEPLREGHVGHSGHYGPYILTTEGRVHDVNRHYRDEHGLALPYTD